jgi:AraC family transcriptional regulator, dual regulator of chb operon
MLHFKAEEVLFEVTARVGCSCLRGEKAFPLHRHDFPEVFWVSQGWGVHWVNGKEHPLGPGSLVFVRPNDAHAFGSDEEGVMVNNVAFEPFWFAGFRQRHFEGERDFWSGAGELPEHVRLAPAQVVRLTNELSELGRSGGGARSAERFLLNLLYVCAAEARSTSNTGPLWMEPALRAWAEPSEWMGGTRALARLAGRSEEHVARAVRAATGSSPTDLLNAHRMRHAAHLLAATDRKVIDIALECGYSSLGHFYEMFQRHHGCPPAVYRRMQPPRPV